MYVDIDPAQVNAFTQRCKAYMIAENQCLCDYCEKFYPREERRVAKRCLPGSRKAASNTKAPHCHKCAKRLGSCLQDNVIVRPAAIEQVSLFHIIFAIPLCLHTITLHYSYSDLCTHSPLYLYTDPPFMTNWSAFSLGAGSHSGSGKADVGCRGPCQGALPSVIEGAKEKLRRMVPWRGAASAQRWKLRHCIRRR